jgi:hypothetical protein
VGLYLAAVGIGRDDGNHAAASKGREGAVGCTVTVEVKRVP